MNPLESQWFFHMIEGSAKTPAERLLAIFRVAENWMGAPGIRDTLVESYAQGAGVQSCNQLKAFLSRLASSAGAEKPDMLASHLVILLQGAIAEELRNPELRALSEAANAARAVIAQSRTRHRRTRHALLACGGFAASIFAGFLSWHLIASNTPLHPKSHGLVVATQQAVLVPSGISPGDMETILNLHEQFARGICQAPQLLMLPPGQMTAYTNVINFRTPENPTADRENIRALLAWFQKTQSADCYYAPKNGHTTASWTKG